MSEEISTITQSSNKLQKLEEIASGKTAGLDSASLKNKLATFIIAHADKVMDTVAPLEMLREELTQAYIDKVTDRLEDPDISPEAISNIIYNIQSMNKYSIQTLAHVLDADKLQTFISINTTDNSQSQVNVLNLESAPSRSKVAKTVAMLTKLMQQSESVEEVQSDDN